MIDFSNLSKNPVSHWQYRGSFDFEVPIGAFGFIYLIEQKFPGADTTKYRYIGRKYLTAAKTTTKKVLLKSGLKKTQKKKAELNLVGEIIPDPAFP